MKSKSRLRSLSGIIFILFLVACGSGTSQEHPIGIPNPEAPDFIQPSLQKNKGEVSDIRFSNDGSQIAIATHNGIRIYNSTTFEELSYISTDRWVGSVAFSPDSKSLVAGIAGKALRMVSLPSGNTLFDVNVDNLFTSSISGLAFIENGESVAAISLDGCTRIFDSSNGNLIYAPDCDEFTLNSLAVSPQSQFATLRGGATYRIWKMENDKYSSQVFTIPGLFNALNIYFITDGSTLLVIGYDEDHIGLVQLIDSYSGLPINSFTTCKLSSGSFVNKGDDLLSGIVAIGCEDGSIKIYSTGFLEKTSTSDFLAHENGYIYEIAISTDGKTIVSYGSKDHNLKFWDVNGNLLKVIEGFVDT